MQTKQRYKINFKICGWTLFILLGILVVAYYMSIYLAIKFFSMHTLGIFLIILALIMLIMLFRGVGLDTAYNFPPIPFVNDVFSKPDETNFLKKVKLLLFIIAVLIFGILFVL